ncbi:hypothetical protein CANINC_002011 [Pichia inconspicua]|uniref:Uncharacterized protein n=1 Tax=Pichia inconspicua TaxID=52247 RepID=A0A4T0X2N6_9ASCO|nr:hypothetical protein CANINC_002011 [[Candida] inconspicua]
MIAESYSKIGKSSQPDKYKTLISPTPNLDFVNGEAYKFNCNDDWKYFYGTTGTTVTHDNVDGVKINSEYIKCLTWFHPVKNDLKDPEKAETFFNNMEPTFKKEFTSYLVSAKSYKFNPL